jgi:S-DNA-T family DNA segregation ATPase FtsK/SpoIIIE
LGAEKLLGQGDMLYKYGIETLRLHSSYIGENEIEQLISRIAENGPCYNQLALDYMKGLMENEHQTLDGSSGEANYWETPDKSPLEENYQGNAPSIGQDELYNDAIRIVNEHKMASASMLQRRLKIGYNRAANLIDMMELNGIVGPAQGAKPREVLSSGNMLSDNTF